VRYISPSTVLRRAYAIAANCYRDASKNRVRPVFLRHSNALRIGCSKVTNFLTNNVALELIAATTKHDVLGAGSKIGTVGVLPPTLTVQYHFMPDATIRPYAGAGLNYTRFYSVNLPAGLDVSKNSFGGALQAGVDFQVNKDVFINLDVKKIFMKTDVTANGAYLTTLTINPVVIGLGVGMKF